AAAESKPEYPRTAGNRTARADEATSPSRRKAPPRQSPEKGKPPAEREGTATALQAVKPSIQPSPEGRRLSQAEAGLAAGEVMRCGDAKHRRTARKRTAAHPERERGLSPRAFPRSGTLPPRESEAFARKRKAARVERPGRREFVGIHFAEAVASFPELPAVRAWQQDPDSCQLSVGFWQLTPPSGGSFLDVSRLTPSGMVPTLAVPLRIDGQSSLGTGTTPLCAPLRPRRARVACRRAGERHDVHGSRRGRGPERRPASGHVE